jgi:peptidoglycan hydrolase-like protein with peptidoglycan-binding domain
LGRQTIAAVRDYQKDRGLAADGFATPGLLEVLAP